MANKHEKNSKLEAQLMKMRKRKFYDVMVGEFTKDADTDRMAVAIKVMEKRFPEHSKPDQLAWVMDKAIFRNNAKMITYLLEQGAAANGTTAAHVPELRYPAAFNPVETAIICSTAETLAQLFNRGADPNPPRNAYLHSAAYIQSSPSKARVLLKHGATGGAAAAVAGLLLTGEFPGLVQEIIRKTGLDVDERDGQLLRSAVRRVSEGKATGCKAVALMRKVGADFEVAARGFEKEQAHAGGTPLYAALTRRLAKQQP
jgi:hypothetical protein